MFNRAGSAPERGDEQGQILVLAALLFTVVLGMTALAIDVGFFARADRDLQNDADAMALAGARELPVTSAATTRAREWGARNGVSSSEIQSISYGVTCSGQSVNDTITVRLRRPQVTFFGRILGVTSGNVNACATARRGQAERGNGLLPIGMLHDNPNIASNPEICYYTDPDVYGDECVIKVPKPSSGDTWVSGNTGPLRLDDPNPPQPNYPPGCRGQNNGNDEYGDNIVNGSQCYYKRGDKATPLTGAQANTCGYFEDRLDGNTDKLADVFISDTDGDGVYDVVNRDSPRFGLIPVVKIAPGASGSSQDITIVEYVAVYIVDISCSGGGVNEKATVTVIPMRAEVYYSETSFRTNPGAPGEALFWVIKLIE
ncbi:MAG TPA: pilus assembly protein TadG-related protein [Dehalococcoidia bacterium]|nr:pilus assembly protein TadG-related protein [Dehalococcoidia bacterium]